MRFPDLAGRRAFVLAALGALLAPGPLPAQPPGPVVRVGVLGSAGAAAFADNLVAFRQTLTDLGWVEGKNLVLEERYPAGGYDQLPALAAQLVALPADAIFTMGSPATHAARKTTTTIPIVMETLGDAVKTGLVASLARPGGNVTGVSGFAPDLTGKRLELTRELLPGAARISAIANRGNVAAAGVLEVIEATARRLRMQVQVTDVRALAAVEAAFQAAVRARTDAVLVVTDPMLASQRKRIVELAARHRMPAVYDGAAWTEAGGLLSYGQRDPERFVQAAVYVDRILRGARPGDLPIVQPSTFELVLNLRAARGLGLTVPAGLVLRADRVIE